MRGKQSRSQFEIELLCVEALRAMPGYQQTWNVRIVELKGARSEINRDVLMVRPRPAADLAANDAADLAIHRLQRA